LGRGLNDGVFSQDSSSASTKSAISAGTITITDQANQKQDVATLNRETSNLNGTVSKTPDLQQVLSNQSDLINAAQAAAETIAKQIGSYADKKREEAQTNANNATDPTLKAQYQQEADSWAEGGGNRVALHIAGGALTGGLTGGGLGAVGGAAGAGVSAKLAPQLNEIAQSIKDAGPTGNANVDELLGNLTSNVLAGGAGALVGGGTGALTGASADRFNRQLNQDEKKAIHDKANGDKDEEKRLTRAACYVVKCWAEYAVGSDDRNKNFVSEVEAASLTKEFDWVSQQKSSGLFEYTALQKGGDAIKSDPVGVAKDAAKVTLGSITTKTGIGFCTTGLGCAAGVPMIAFGTSEIAEGADGLYNRYNGAYAPGVNALRDQFNQTLSGYWGPIAYDGLSLVASLAALYAPVPLKMGVADGLNRPNSIFGVMVPKINNKTLVPFLNRELPYGTTQGMLLFGIGSKGMTVINDIQGVEGKK